MNPFDIKSALLQRHAQHVVLIHFPIALFLASVTFDLVAHWSRKQALAAVARYNLLLAALSTLPVMLTGILAWRWQFEGGPLKGILLVHMLAGIASSALIWLVWWLHFRGTRDPMRSLPAYRLPIEILACAVVAFTAHAGGILSGINAGL